MMPIASLIGLSSTYGKGASYEQIPFLSALSQ